MNAPASRARDAVAHVVSLHRERACAALAPLVTAELIEEHRRDPLARTKSPQLLRVLDVMRQAPIQGKLAVLEVEPSCYQVIRLNGTPGETCDLSDPRRFAAERDALHAVFLARLAELGLSDGVAAGEHVPGSWVASQEESASFVDSLHRYLIGYADRLWARPGESVAIHLAAHEELRASAELVRLAVGAERDGVREQVLAQLGEVAVGPQVTQIGSCAIVQRFASLRLSFGTLALTAMPTAPGGRLQVLAAQGEGAGRPAWQLGLDEDGRPFARWADAGQDVALRLPAPLRAGVWYSWALRAAPDGIELAVHPHPASPAAWAVAPEPAQEARCAAPAEPVGWAPAPLVFGARPTTHGWEHVFDGKIERPEVFDDGAVGPAAEVAAALAGRDPALREAARAWWSPAAAIDAEGVSDQRVPCLRRDGLALIRDRQLDAECRNTPTWAVTSSSWDGTEQDFTKRPKDWDAIHFHCDDLDDCHWPAALSVALPDDLDSGAYAVRLRAAGVATERVPFFVEPARPVARLAVIVPTVSYLAYANDHPGTYAQMAQATASRTPVLKWGDLFMQLHPELGLSCYDAHADGTGVGYSSARRPLLNMRPTHRYHVGAWQLPADLQLLAWLHEEGIAADIVTDHTLHEHGLAAISGYRALATSTHGEYYTTRMLDAVEAFVADGGKLAYLGANGFYWRCALDPARPWVMELRRGENGSRAWEGRPGELYHAWTAERGGLWRYQGRGPHKTFGVGFCAQGFDSSGWYRLLPDAADPRASFIVEGVAGETFGHLGKEGGGAAGQELDRFDPDLGSPAGTLLLATSEGLSDGYLRAVEEIGFLVHGTSAATDPFVRADVTYLDNDAGGAVFSTGSIAWCGALGLDPGVTRITRNVLTAFTAG